MVQPWEAPPRNTQRPPGEKHPQTKRIKKEKNTETNDVYVQIPTYIQRFANPSPSKGERVCHPQFCLRTFGTLESGARGLENLRIHEHIGIYLPASCCMQFGVYVVQFDDRAPLSHKVRKQR